MSHIAELGRRIELVPMDPHCHDITLALYETRGAAPAFRVHSYSMRSGAAERVAFVTEAMKVLGDMESVPGAPTLVRFRCGAEHKLACRRLFLEACKLAGDAALAPRPPAVVDRKTGRTIRAVGLGDGAYRVEMADGGAGEPGASPAWPMGSTSWRKPCRSARIALPSPVAGRMMRSSACCCRARSTFGPCCARRRRLPAAASSPRRARRRPDQPEEAPMETAKPRAMTSRQRVLAALRREPVDRTPVCNPTSIATVELMDLADAHFPEANRNPELMARLAATGHTELGFDSIMPVFSIIQESSALGCKIQWEQKDNWPTVKMREPIWRDADDIRIPNDLLVHPGHQLRAGGDPHAAAAVRRRGRGDRQDHGPVVARLPLLRGRDLPADVARRSRPDQALP